MNGRISVKEIAEMAGTSVATVSRVINQNGRFSKATEQRVREVIKQYGYQPNQLARSLRVQRSQVIGIMVPDITNEFFARITQEVQKNLLLHDYMTLICSTNENVVEAKAQVQMLQARKVDGLVYIGGEDIPDIINVPTVYIDRDPRDSRDMSDDNYVLIECDNIQGGYLAGKELVEKGARKLASVSFDVNLSTVRKRLMGFERAINEAGLELDEKLRLDVSGQTLEAGMRATAKLLELCRDVDGIFYTSDMLAVGGLSYLQEQGIPVPGKVRIVGFDGITLTDIVHPHITTVQQSCDEFGRQAAQEIIDMINGKTIEPQRQRIPVELIVRETT